MPRAFRLVSGKYRTEGSGRDVKRYKAGDIVSSERDLVAVFPNKFEEVHSESNFKVVAEQVEVAETEEEKENTETPVEPVVSEDERANVTELFPDAETAQLLVFAEGGKYWVAEPDASDDNLNTKGLGKRAVRAFISDYLEGKENEE
jgi:hypothetical protein